MMTIAAVAAGLALLGGGIVTSLAGASARASSAAPAPSVVGLLDLARLMNSLQELKDRNDITMVKGKGMKEKLEELTNQLKAIDAELKDVIPKDDKSKRIEKAAQKYELEVTLEARVKAYQRLLDLDHGDILRDLYPKVTQAIKDFAQKNSLDMVLLDDRAIQMPESGAVKDYNEVIQRKRVLFAKDGLDVTDQLVTMMNNEYTAQIKK